jgi:hypothetical protein
MEGGADPANRGDFPGGFEAGPGQGAFVDNTRTPQQQAIWSWFRQLLQLRREHASLACGTEQVLDAAQNDLVYMRSCTSACPAENRAPAEDADLIVLQRETRSMTIELKATAAEGCTLSRPVLGQATSEKQDTRLTITPSTHVVILPCHLERR